MKTYQVRYSVWKVQANSKAQARAKVLAMLKKDLPNLVSIEEDTKNRSLWSLLFWGP